MTADLLHALYALMSVKHAFALVFGTMLGLVVGILPGLGGIGDAVREHAPRHEVAIVQGLLDEFRLPVKRERHALADGSDDGGALGERNHEATGREERGEEGPSPEHRGIVPGSP